MEKPELPAFVSDILARLNSAGFEAFIVGGPVRDILLGKTPQDWDIATSALPEDVLSLFEKTVQTGVKHGTVTVLCGKNQAEITTYRAESAYSDRRHPDEVRFIPDLRQDLARRDFTINAMALSASGDVKDYFGGARDLERGLIRCVGDPKTRFEEDALRMLRALRFKAVLGFEIEPDTLAAIKECAKLAESLSAERVRDEIMKILKSGSPEVLETAIEARLLSSYLEPAAVSFKGLAELNADGNVRLAALCFRLKKGGLIASPECFLSKLRFSGKTVSLAGRAADILTAGLPREIPAVKQFLRDFGPDAVSCAANAASDESFRNLLNKAHDSGECWNLKQLAVNGTDIAALGVRGSGIGAVLDSLLDHVIQIPQDNERNILLNSAKKQMNIPLT